MEAAGTTAKVLPQCLLRALPLTHHHYMLATALGCHEAERRRSLPHELWLPQRKAAHSVPCNTIHSGESLQSNRVGYWVSPKICLICTSNLTDWHETFVSFIHTCFFLYSFPKYVVFLFAIVALGFHSNYFDSIFKHHSSPLKSVVTVF